MTGFVEHSGIAGAAPFNPDETHGIAKRPGCNIEASSADLGWRSLLVSLLHEPVTDASYRGVPHHLLVMQLSGPVHLNWGICGQSTSRTVPVGSCTFVPAGAEFSMRFTDALDTVHIYLRKELVDRVVAERVKTAPQLHPFLGVSEPLLEQLIFGCMGALRRAGPSSALYVDHLAWALAAHLVESQSEGLFQSHCDVAGLTERQLQRVRAYIEANLESDIGVEALAAAAGLSPVYFARQFKLRTGIPPYRYLLAARIERAKTLLRADQMPICEVALACGFCHQEHLTRVFRAHCGISPAAFRRMNRGH